MCFHVEIKCPYPVEVRAGLHADLSKTWTLVIFVLCFGKKKCPSKKCHFEDNVTLRSFCHFSSQTLQSQKCTLPLPRAPRQACGITAPDFQTFFLITVMRAPSVVKQKHTTSLASEKRWGKSLLMSDRSCVICGDPVQVNSLFCLNNSINK